MRRVLTLLLTLNGGMPEMFGGKYIRPIVVGNNMDKQLLSFVCQE